MAAEHLALPRPARTPARLLEGDPVKLEALGVALSLWTLGATGCADARKDPQAVALAAGPYRVASGGGYQASDEPLFLATTARLDRAASRLVLTLADGSERSLGFAPRPEERWLADCYTMASHTLSEVADITPAPLDLYSLHLATPVAYAKCSPNRMILANAPGDESTFLVLDLVP
jgi:hypothetical protein